MTRADVVKSKVRRCANDACRKPIGHMRSDATVCSPKCRYVIKNKDKGDQPEVWICLACKHPTQLQAEIILGPAVKRHPVSGPRPHQWSGYCVITTCGCPICRPENQPQEANDDR